MNKPNVLWLSMSPSLKCFDQRLLARLTKTATVRRWEYCQTMDEPCCVESVVAALHEYVSDRASLEKSLDGPAQPIHLAGHGVSGIVALLYAQRYPEHVASLTLLSVSARPAVNWQAHYYALRQLLPCSREMVLAHMVRLLFGQQPLRFAKALAQLLANDLDSSLTLHSLAHHTQITPGQITTGQTPVPTLVCNGAFDAVTGSTASYGGDDGSWQSWRCDQAASCSPVASDASLPSFRLWNCPKGNHFFHFYQAALVATEINAHWQSSLSTPAFAQSSR